MINQSSSSHVGGLKLHGGVLRRRILPGPCGKRSTRHPVEGALHAGTNTTINVNISTYLLSVDRRLLKSRTTSVRDTLPIHHTNIGTRRGMSKRWYTTRSREDVSLQEESVEQAGARDIPCQVANPPTVYPLSHVYVTMPWKSTSSAACDAPDTSGGTPQLRGSLQRDPVQNVSVDIPSRVCSCGRRSLDIQLCILVIPDLASNASRVVLLWARLSSCSSTGACDFIVGSTGCDTSIGTTLSGPKNNSFHTWMLAAFHYCR